jgi:hypothetical protein
VFTPLPSNITSTKCRDKIRLGVKLFHFGKTKRFIFELQH